ncbi:hypothetical protein L1887_38030 [Cichorium endivia]|nr:hypothetical protein L1887_38030 [Cichorium endivia]
MLFFECIQNIGDIYFIKDNRESLLGLHLHVFSFFGRILYQRSKVSVDSLNYYGTSFPLILTKEIPIANLVFFVGLHSINEE